MDQEQYQQLPAAPFPAPPPFWKHFTQDNLSRFADLTSTASPTSSLTDLTLPLELSFLRPPPPPPAASETYTTFSIPQSLNPTPVPPPPEILLFDPPSSTSTDTTTLDPSLLLTRLTKSVLLNFLELTTVLSNDPMKHDEKLADIKRIMLNIHYVINMYRPHQAREGVKEMLRDRLEAGRREIERCEEVKGRVEAFLGGLEGEKGRDVSMRNGDGDEEGTGRVTGEDGEEGKRLWEMIHGLDDG